MTRYLLDTNIISELSKAAPNKNVIKFVATLDRAWLSIITVHEIVYGLHLLPKGTRRFQLEQAIKDLMQYYEPYIIPIGDEEAEVAAILRATAKASGKPSHLADTLIAGTAQVHALTIVTRNIKDFAHHELDLMDPWVDHRKKV